MLSRREELDYGSAKLALCCLRAGEIVAAFAAASIVLQKGYAREPTYISQIR